MNIKHKCPASEYCGGCSYQGINYSKQLDIKQDNINKLLNKFGKIYKIIGMKNPNNYRNKVQVSFGYDEKHHVLCGNYVPSSHTIVPISDCMICDKTSNSIISSIVKLIIKYKISIFDENSMKGCIRHVLIRSTSLNEYMVVIVTGTFNINKKELFIKDLLKYNKEITTIVQNINNRRTSMILGQKSIWLYGKGYVIDKLCDLFFRISPSSFYQINKFQTEILYHEAIKKANLNQNSIVIDAYCGTGTIGLVASKYCKEVLGIDINRQSIKDALTNMKINNINNVTFVEDDASKYMSYLAKQKIHVDVVILDPPRTGTDRKFMDSIFKLKPSTVVYISCNPVTLRDNLEYFNKYYAVKSIQPIDMFPYTSHVECCVALNRK